MFKAKRLDNGEWFEGVPVDITPLSCFEGDVKKEAIMARAGFADWGMPRGLEFAKIDPETICQYTGLTDKNGKKVFEGDRMETKYKDEGEVFVMKGTVVYIENSFMVLLDDGKMLEDLDTIYLIQAYIIGNIHDEEN